MAMIGSALQPYSQHLYNMTVLFSCVKLMCGLKSLFNMQARPPSDLLTIKAVLGAVVIAALGLRLAQLGEDQAMFNFNCANLSINTSCLLIFYRYATPDTRQWMSQKMLLVMGIISLCCWYSFIEETETAYYNLSLIRTGTTSVVILMALAQGTSAVSGCVLSVIIAMVKLLHAITLHNTPRSYQCLLVFMLDLLHLCCQLMNTTPRRDIALACSRLVVDGL
ncbi:hypothetical protein KR222_006917 [Zaprionus bogoriensis]|nr:hypothetical protein KR222_006917 [Zaprionus bogoriensis]